MISITLRRETLESLEACEGGLALFDSIAEGRQSIAIEWAPAGHLWLARDYPSFFGWLRDGQIVPTFSFRGADLSGANLRGVDLSGANLRGADLEGAIGYTP